jgi:hypothetical protein
MARKVEYNTSYSVNFSMRDRNAGDDIKTINMNWENRSVDEVQENLNTWLRAIGVPLEVVKPNEVIK